MKYACNRLFAFLFVFFFVVALIPEETIAARLSGEDSLVTTTRPQPKTNGEIVPNALPGKVNIPKQKIIQNNEEKISTQSEYITIDFDNVDIRVFIKFISELTGKNFVIDKNVRGTVTIVSPRKISVQEAYKVFQSVLEVHGYAAVPSGDVTKIVPSLSAREKNVETRLKKEAISPEDRIVTQIIPLIYANPNEMKNVLTPLVSKASVILAYSPTGMLIVTDLLSNIKRLLKIIEALDAPGIEEQITVLPLQYAIAQDIANSLNAIFQKKAVPGKNSIETAIKIVPDERTNTIIILASENDGHRIKELVKLLDKEVPKGDAKVRVFRLQNADATELTQVLMSLPVKDSQANQQGKGSVLPQGVQVVPDKSTNTLIITANRDDYQILEDVINELDVPRPMVYIEALILEVNVEKDFNLGVEWMAGEYASTEGRKKVVAGGFGGSGQYSNITGISEGKLPSGFSLGLFGESISIGSLTFPNISAILQTYQKDQDVHILSTPQILTLDNEEAEIQIAQNVPYLTKEASGDQNYQTYEYKDVGVTLKITPQINFERFVRLNIYQEVTKLIGNVGESDRPSTFKRTAKTTVTIKDKNTIVIGGLIGEDITDTEYKVPCLGDIPILGWLFKYENRYREKNNLFIFITPHIIENPGEAQALYNDKKEQIDKIREGVIKMKGHIDKEK